MAEGQINRLFARASEVDGALLYGVMASTSRTPSCVPGFEGLSCGFDRQLLGLSCVEVYPNIYVGDAACARDRNYLQRIGITHVLNAALGVGVGMVDINASYYQGLGLNFLGLPIIDHPLFELTPYFQTAVDFVSGGFQSGGKVLVYCLRGKSRSISLAIAYLMIKVGMPAPMALRICCSKVEANINLGFLSEIATLHNGLRAMVPQ
ncbi:Dual specificity protein phosphatase 3 [Frankliniella fusca]|uniref:Dual specificity protein phosphatase n=1 Tax=Frankliniella fusca TaxID=407009 RepID=A0AAE1HFS2_9NEOP|nr:Dual specificity protein phosphatase 3 [Frankliniella fusca]KAK3920550.1 Dual specificity protein phosphatase 3 [Frankliniella fusca]